MVNYKIKAPLRILAVLFILCLALFLLSRSKSYQILGDIHSHINTSQKFVALTFDDGPTKQVSRVLSILDTHRIRATFFLTGKAMENRLAEVQKIIASGHEIGNHSYSHRRMLFMSYKKIQEEVEKTDSLIRLAGYKPTIHFRPPYGKKLFVLPYYLWKNKRKTIMWDVDPESTPEITREPAQITKYVIDNVQSGSIILLHVMFESGRNSINALPTIITGLKHKGFEFKTISEMLKYEEL